MSRYIDIVFDGPPSHESGRFVEVENDKGEGVQWGEWVEREDGHWVLRYTPSSGLSTEKIVERAFEVYLRTEKFAVATAIRHALKLARGEPTDD